MYEVLKVFSEAVPKPSPDGPLGRKLFNEHSSVWNLMTSQHNTLIIF